MIKKPLLIGAHLSTAGGLYNALLTAQKIDCTCVQIFTHSNRQWNIKPIAQDEIDRFIETRQETGMQAAHIVVHATYLLNLASPEAATRKRSVAVLIKELERCRDLEIPYLVVHPGARLTGTLEDALQYCAESIDTALEAVKGPTLLVENMAGQGTIICSRFEELALIHKLVHHKRHLGFCFDTCHAFAAGYDFTTPAGYKAVMGQFNDLIGLDHLKVIHMNDSQKPCGSHVDRHTHIGKGLIGLEGFRLIMQDKRLSGVPKILETPKGKGLEDDIMNLDILRRLTN